MKPKDFESKRRRMVETQIAARGIKTERVLAAFRTVSREQFVPSDLADFAYDDAALPIEAGQTISQPFVVALMVDALELSPQDRVLEIGAGSGYAAAVLSQIAHEVYTVERQPELAELTRERCQRLGYINVWVLYADGTVGWPEHAPYDGIVVAAGAPEVPAPLKEQLVVGGRLVIPIGRTPDFQTLLRVTRRGEDKFDEEDLGEVRFVPLVGAKGWTDNEKHPRRKSGIETKEEEHGDPLEPPREPDTG